MAIYILYSAKDNYCEKHVNNINQTKSFQNTVLGFILKGLSTEATKKGVTSH